MKYSLESLWKSRRSSRRWLSCRFTDGASRSKKGFDVVHVCKEDQKEQLKDEWASLVEEPARRAGLPVPKYVELQSPYRLVITPVVDYVLMLQVENPDRQIVLIVPELIELHWYHYFLQSNRGELLGYQTPIALAAFRPSSRVRS